jgi:1,4-alpha-glucan branching enzyme
MTTYVFGWDNETFTQKKEIERNKQYPYESTTGTRYQYDLTKPGDQIRYKVDPAAQIRDNVNPRVEIDRQLHQYGGGSE